MQWLHELGGDLVIEFVTRQDPMVVTLLRNKDDHYSDYTEETSSASWRRGSGSSGVSLSVRARASCTTRPIITSSCPPERGMPVAWCHFQALDDLDPLPRLESRWTRRLGRGR